MQIANKLNAMNYIIMTWLPLPLETATATAAGDDADNYDDDGGKRLRVYVCIVCRCYVVDILLYCHTPAACAGFWSDVPPNYYYLFAVSSTGYCCRDVSEFMCVYAVCCVSQCSLLMYTIIYVCENAGTSERTRPMWIWYGRQGKKINNKKSRTTLNVFVVSVC